MKAPFAFLTICAGLALNVQADGLRYPPESVNTSSVARAEVRAELARARMAGDGNEGEIIRFADPGNSSLTRAAVQAELARERTAGKISSGEPGYPSIQP